MRRLAVLVFSVLFTVPAFAGDGAISLSPDLAGWERYEFPGRKPAQFEGSDNSVVVMTSGSTSILYREVGQAARGRPVLTWRWQVFIQPPATDLSGKGGDDRPLMLHLSFPEPEHEQGLMGQIGFGSPVAGRTLTYVWGGIHDRGTVLPNPYHADGIIIVLESSNSPQAQWRDVSVDWAADYQSAFGEPAPVPRYLGLSADSDDTRSASVGAFRDIRFGPR